MTPTDAPKNPKTPLCPICDGPTVAHHDENGNVLEWDCLVCCAATPTERVRV